MRLPIHKAHDPKCSCVTGKYECWHCRKPKLDKIYRNLTPAQQEYDRLALAGWPKDDWEAQSCSCHINPPCNFCMREADEAPE